ncbi:MAG: UDP-N-acetylmuramoyl-tripeptide--D-alanyl-D-alanine ligase [Rhodothermia bacterium]|nr:UDP-N-acetylmuramoyl-tripeptide--D-alanyl-D-alanine ligase [Rhodothermia bacterium]
MIGIYILLIVAVAFAGWRIWRRLRFSLHMFQLHGYKVPEYARWTFKRPFDFLIRRSHVAGGVLLGAATLATDIPAQKTLAAVLLLGWTIAFASSKRYRSDNEKKPLAWTNRAKRLFGFALALILVLLLGGAAGLSLSTGLLSSLQRLLGGFLLADLIAPLAVIAAGIVLEPLEVLFRWGFKRKARAKLAAHDNLTVIGITGSYGKTSVKFIVREILSFRYNVLASPGSYNTPMGLCRVVNEMLLPEHQVLVAEMGARYSGDIRELCELVNPSIGIVTNVGVAHLESMGSVDNIEREKGDLPASISPGGTVVLNADDERVMRMADRTEASVLTVSATGRNADFSASEVQYGADGSAFTITARSGESLRFRSSLLGSHNISNILMGVAVGASMGLRLRQMAHAVAAVQPVEHRLQLRKEGAITVIDDAFNSNPVGARNAVEILGQFRTGRRVIVTPGMIELGDIEFDENRRLGEAIADNVDLAILIGPERTAAIAEGLAARGFPDDKVQVFRSLFDARDFLKQYLREGDVVLYENDLPDQYEEAA